MKKLFIASSIALAATAASALEVGVTVARDYAGSDRNAVGFTIGQQVGIFNVTTGFDRTTVSADNQNRFSLAVGYNVAKLGPVAVAAKVGGVYLNNKISADGYASIVGVGATLPINKTMAATVDFTHQFGQNRVEAFDGNRLTAGVKYNF